MTDTTAFTITTTEVREYRITVDSNAIQRVQYRDAIESASDIDNALQCLLDEGATFAEADAGKRISYDIEVVD